MNAFRNTHLTVMLPSLLVLGLCLIGCHMNSSDSTPSPRHQALKTFDPHRKDFICKREADSVPPIDSEAEAWNQQGLYVTRFVVPEDQKDWKQAESLWTQAAERRHWKAMMNLASLYEKGKGTGPFEVKPNGFKAVEIVEEAMRLGIPAAYDKMGNYHSDGTGGIRADGSRAWAFWELAADMGNPQSLTRLGKATDAGYDNPDEGFWANRTVALKMLECAFSQGYGPAALELGITLDGAGVDDRDNYNRALVHLHEGVKFGSEDSANYLFGTFDDGDPMVHGIKDPSRARRYAILGDALYHNPDLRFPNLDKVLPLPPAPLPKWDGNEQTLIDAAKAVVPLPPPPPQPVATPASQRIGRAHIPEGWILPDKPQTVVQAQWETVSAPESGYWIARLIRPVTDRQRAWDASQLPLRYSRGELFDRTRPGLRDEDGRIQFHYLGQPIEEPPARPIIKDPRVARGIARYGDIPEPARRCRGHLACPKAGIWAASIAPHHERSRVFNQWDRQSYVLEGQRFPDPRLQCLDIEAHDVVWRWLGQPNEVRAGGIVHIELVNVETQPTWIDGPMTSAKTLTGVETHGKPTASSRRPVGQLALTGDICPETGWWQSQGTALPVQGGRRHFFRAGECMAGIVLLGKGSLWQWLRGTSPTYPADTVWELVDYEKPVQQAATTKPSAEPG